MVDWFLGNSTTFSQFRSLYSVERDQKVTISGKNVRNSREGVTIPAFHGRTEKTTNASVRMCGNSDQIQTEDLHNTSYISFFFTTETNLLG
jgi:hypothetical protein